VRHCETMSIAEIMSDLYLISQCIKFGDLAEEELDKLFAYKEQLIKMYEKVYKK